MSVHAGFTYVWQPKLNFKHFSVIIIINGVKTKQLPLGGNNCKNPCGTGLQAKTSEQEGYNRKSAGLGAISENPRARGLQVVNSELRPRRHKSRRDPLEA